MRVAIVAVSALVLGSGCSMDVPTEGNSLEARFTQTGTSRCYTVSGEIEQSGAFPSFAGTITGDVEGTVSTQLDPANARAAGRATFSSGVQTWQVTGGSVTELVGRQVRLAIQSDVVFAQPPAGRNNTTARVIEGAASGNLTYHGTLIVSPPPPFDVSVQYHGVICP